MPDPAPAPAPAPTPAPAIVLPPLPTWTDPASVTSYVTSILAGIFAIVTAATGKGEPALVQALLPASGLVVAGVAQIVNVITHRGVQKAAIHAASVSSVGW